MKKILFVEDDALVTRLYSQKLSDAGFEVLVASDGSMAVDRLLETMPDLVVLDLLMPRLNGVEVLRVMRSHSTLKTIPVVVFSNALLDQLRNAVSALGVEEIMIKSGATPALLIKAIQRILERGKRAVQTAPVEAVKAEAASETGGTKFYSRVQREFFDQVPALAANIRELTRNPITQASSQMEQLESLSRKAGFITQMAGAVSAYRVAQMSAAFEAFLFELRQDATLITDSTRRTIQQTGEFLADFLGRANRADEQTMAPSEILVVDDDRVTGKTLQMALNRASLDCTCISDAAKALEVLRTAAFDAVVLDINLPGMDGTRLCQWMRDLPLHKQTPVIFITSHVEFQPRARAILNSGDELIAKPVMPTELVVKLITQILKARMARRPARS